MPSTDPPPAKRTASALKDEVSHAVTAIRTGFMELLAGLPPVQRPADLARVLGIDYSMSRKAMRIIEATDPIGIATEIPRPAGMPRILKACAKLGIDKKALARLEQAVENYESLAKRHGGDRPTFDAMIAGLSPEANERAQFEAKRAAYRANTQLLGRQADTAVFFKAVRPSQHREDYLEVIWICAQFGLKRFHPSASLEVMTTTATGPMYPMDQSSSYQTDSFLIREFCSNPLPNLKQLPPILPEGLTRFELDSDEIGLESAADCVIGQVCHLPRSDPNRLGQRLFGLQSVVDFPTKTMLMDLFVHESLVPTMPPICFTYSNSFPLYGVVPSGPPDPSLLLSVQEKAQVLGRGPASLRTKEIPRYDQLVRQSFEQMGWTDPDGYQLIRSRVEYPILNAYNVLRIPV